MRWRALQSTDVPPAAPAIANAVRALTGAKLRMLPMLPDRVKAALKS
jgi:isoquinoline 1-oxidoreductase subunit beta